MNKFVDNLMVYKYMSMRVKVASCRLTKEFDEDTGRMQHWEVSHTPTRFLSDGCGYKSTSLHDYFKKKPDAPFKEIGNTLIKEGIYRPPIEKYDSPYYIEVNFKLLALDNHKAIDENMKTYGILKYIIAEKGDEAVDEYIESLKQRGLLINVKNT